MKRLHQLICALALGWAGCAAAQGLSALQVADDPGGDVALRLRQLERLRREGRAVEIRRGYCNSACTLYLGLARTCVGRAARFGFHGPSSGIPGLGLTPEAFDRWSRLMARQYPEPIRSWFLREGRLITVGTYTISGGELIRLGVPECA